MLTTIQALARLHMLAKLSPRELAKLAEDTLLIDLEKNQTLFSAGEPTKGFYGVISGQLHLGVTDHADGRGTVKTLAVINPGEMFCDAIAFLHTAHPVAATAAVSTLVVLIEREAILALIARNDEFALKMFGHMSRAMEKMVYELRDLKLSSASKRVACFLLHYAPKMPSNTYEITLPIQKRVLAERLNLSPAHLSRTFAQLIKAEVIDMQGRIISVKDAKRLKQLASFELGRASHPHVNSDGGDD